MVGKIFSCLVLLCFTHILSLQARVSLTSVFSDNMVLQQNSEVLFKGYAKPLSRVVCTVSWSKTRHITHVATDGQFEIKIKTPAGSKSTYSLCFDDGEKYYLRDVLIGDVWFCSGQSNMEMSVKGFRGQPVRGSLEALVNAKGTRYMRLFKVNRAWSTVKKENGLEGVWQLPLAQHIAEFSAAAYFFGDVLERNIDVPIGLIDCSYSMSKIETWMSEDMLKAFPDIKIPEVNETNFGWLAGTPTLLFNAMVNPWKGFPVKGMIWYQGEANSDNPSLYKQLFPAMALGYRQFFNQQELPIYYVQLAPWQSVHKDSTNLASFRQIQLDLMREVPNVGMVNTGDLGDEVFIHPPKKKEVGERLAYWALAKTYDKKGFQYTGPIYRSAVKKEGAVIVSFDYSQDGLNPENEDVLGFELAGEDQIFVEAKAQIINATTEVKVWSNKVVNPKYVRYCFRNYKIGNLVNNFGLPAASFMLKID